MVEIADQTVVETATTEAQRVEVLTGYKRKKAHACLFLEEDIPTQSKTQLL
jgi:hypothetical protein